MKITRSMLLISPDCYSAWNERKKTLIITENLEDEIAFLSLVFTKHPKSVESWSHRRWVVAQLLASRPQQINESIHQRELDVCEKVAQAYPKNYYAWTHRQWVLNQLNLVQVLSEFERMANWVSKRTSDHAGLHYRQSALLRLTQMKMDSRESSPLSLCSIWKTEFEVSHQLITSNPGHEALWCHLRFVIYHYAYFLELTPRLFIEGEETSQTISSRTITSELDFASRCIRDHQVSNFSDQFTLASRYRFWLLHLAEATRCFDSTQLQSILRRSIFKPTTSDHYFDNRTVSTFDLLSQLPSPEATSRLTPLLAFDHKSRGRKEDG